ncbi:hypothetical protein NN561_017796 [Cricetulus griseus]
MAVSTVVSRRVKRKAPRAFLRRTFKQKKPHLRLETACDLLVSPARGARGQHGARAGRRLVRPRSCGAAALSGWRASLHPGTEGGRPGAV